MTEQQGSGRGRRQFVMIVVIFLTPLIIAALWSMNVDRFAPPVGRVNKGNLVDPPRTLGKLESITMANAEALPNDYLNGKWTLVYFAPADCGVECRSALYNLRQLRMALGRQMHRVQGLLIVDDIPNTAFRDHLANTHDALPVVTMPALPTDWAQPFRDVAGGDPAQTGRAWIVDPIGNLMLSYPPGFEPSQPYEDLKRLLKLSRIG